MNEGFKNVIDNIQKRIEEESDFASKLDMIILKVKLEAVLNETGK